MTISGIKAEKFVQLVSGVKRILLVGHTNPDGDSIGSLSGTKAFLREMLPDTAVTAVVPTDFPDFLKFMDPRGEVVNYIDNPKRVTMEVKSADVIICLDFNGLGRIDFLGELIEKSSAKKILVDHHPQPDTIFDLSFSTTDVSSTCELVYWLLKKIASRKGVKMNAEACNSLYVGMMTDTNNFSNSVFPSTFKMAGELMEAGIDKEALQYKVLSCFSENRMRLMGFMLLKKMKIFPELKAACMILDKETKDKFNFKDGDAEGFVNLPLNIAGVEISALFTESEHFIRVSLRSKGDFSVNKLGRKFYNGGGHERAAGGRLYIPVGSIEKYFKDSLRHSF
ncbi:MAG: bifunctional oligoribonuclease/PAP phosphatase NrnA [Bacteroidales bacterium]|jgi:phosphoesterase RecJ-like protein|nr:bifunctional oligoribonuclease/PAP phosphatase NrnA [Bacteroidales bacterium]MCI1734074.1 bifunctional oligoribonuclease/PAP phosphatase NrnA [Bacteroidales bacterium]